MRRVHGLELDRQRAEVAQLDDRRTRAVVREQAVRAAERAVRDAHLVQVAHAGGGAAREARPQRERERRACRKDMSCRSRISGLSDPLRVSNCRHCRLSSGNEVPYRARRAARARARDGTRPRPHCRRCRAWSCCRRRCARRPTPSSAQSRLRTRSARVRAQTPGSRSSRRASRCSRSRRRRRFGSAAGRTRRRQSKRARVNRTPTDGE